MYVRHEVLSVSPSHNTSGLRRSLMDRSEGGGEEKAEQRKMKEDKSNEGMAGTMPYSKDAFHL